MQNNNNLNNIYNVNNISNITSSIQETENVNNINPENQKIIDRMKEINKEMSIIINEVNKKYHDKIKYFPYNVTINFEDNNENNSVKTSLLEYYNNTVSKVFELMQKINIKINILNTYKTKYAKGEESFLKEKLELFKKILSIGNQMKDLVNFYYNYFNNIKNMSITEIKQINLKDFENKFSEKSNALYKMINEIKDALEQYRVKRNLPVPEEEDLICPDDIEKYGKYLTNSEDWFYKKISNLLKINEKLKTEYENLAENVKETEKYRKENFKDLTCEISEKIINADVKSSELFENKECKKGKKKDFIELMKKLDYLFNYAYNFINYLKESSLNFKGKEFNVIYEAKEKDTKLNNINAEETNNIKNLIGKINEKFNTPQESVFNDVNLLLKEEDEIVKTSPSNYYALLSNRIKNFITELNLLIKAWNYYAKQEVDEEFIKKQFKISKKIFDFRKEKVEINKRFFNLCENLNSIIDFYLNFFNFIKKINTNKEKNNDVSEFENKFSEKLNLLFENLSEIENKIEEFRVNTNIPFFENDEPKPIIHLNDTPFSSYASSNQSDDFYFENENENENFILNIDRWIPFEKSYYSTFLKELTKIKNPEEYYKVNSKISKSESLKNKFKQVNKYNDIVINEMINYYNKLKGKKIPLQVILKEQIDKIKNNDRLSDESKKAEIKDIENIINKNKYEETDAINPAGFMVSEKDDAFMKTNKRKMVYNHNKTFKGYDVFVKINNSTDEEENFKRINMVDADVLLDTRYLYVNIPSGLLFKLSDIDDFMYANGITEKGLNLFKKSEFYKPNVIKNIKTLIEMAETKQLKATEHIKTLVETLDNYKELFKEFLSVKDNGLVNEKGEIISKNSNSIFGDSVADFYKEKFKTKIKNIEENITNLAIENNII